MLHKQEKQAIIDTFSKEKFILILSFFGIGNFLENSKSILLIADYYGEKQAIYFLFLIHYVAMLIIPSFFGSILWIIQIYLAAQYNPEEDESSFIIAKYF